MDEEDNGSIVSIRGRVVPGRAVWRSLRFLVALRASAALGIADQCCINIGFPIWVYSEGKWHVFIAWPQHVRLPLSIRCGRGSFVMEMIRVMGVLGMTSVVRIIG